MSTNNIPELSYGILLQNLSNSSFDEAAENVKNLGYTVVDSGYNPLELKSISVEFDRVKKQYSERYGDALLRSINEHNTMRALLTHGGEVFLKLALNENMLSLVAKLIQGKFILNQQNGVINPPQESYNQGAWHRDLPYQHFVSTKSLAINAIYCVDDFTFENGATFVLPSSHKSENFPSKNYIQKNAIQIEAKAGSFIVLDCMTFHAGGFNKTHFPRRAINHVYNIPYFKQQINIPMSMPDFNLSSEVRELLGFSYTEPTSVSEYLLSRTGKTY